jgi:alkaline phosphatase
LNPPLFRTMKLRNQLLAIFCLLVFAAFGFLYVRTWVAPKTFGIILFVSDGMVARELAAARLYEGGADHRLTIEDFPHLALLRNAARDFAAPDAAAAATALATGERVGHRHLAMDGDGRRLASILELAHSQGRATGLVTNGSLSAPTPGAFFAHAGDARDSEEVARQLAAEAQLDVFLGGGAGDFLPATKNGRRKDGRDLLGELHAKGCEIVRSKAELEGATAYRTGQIAGFFSNDQLAYNNQIESGSQQPSLADMVRRAIEFLQVHGKGYVLVVDAALATTAAENNEGELALTETLALDHAIATAVKYAGDRSLILVSGKHATGGFSMNGYPLSQDHGVALLGVNAAGQPTITWATGPNGPPPSGAAAFGATPAEEPSSSAPAQRRKVEPAAFQTPAGVNTVEDVIAVGRGEGSEVLNGFLDQTAIFKVLKDAL